MAKKKQDYSVNVIKTDKNLIEAQWKGFTLTQKKLFWYIAAGMQSNGFTPESVMTKDILTPIETEIYKLETGEMIKHKTSKAVGIEIDLTQLYKTTNITQEAAEAAIDKFQKTTLRYKAADSRYKVFCSLIPKAEIKEDRKTATIYIYAEALELFLSLQHYITMQLQKILNFKSKYTLRFYELLNKIKNQNFAVYNLTLEEANKTFDTKYKRLAQIEAFIIKPAQKELLESSDLNFEYSRILEKLQDYKDQKRKGRRKVTEFKIMLSLNKQPSLF
jgi:hypothetical protein